MEYQQLNVDTVGGYIASLPEMKEILSSFDDLDIAEIGDGNLNFVFTITNRKSPDETVILKQAVPFLRVVGESWPLSRERMNTEIAALRYQSSVCPELVPRVYHASGDMSLVVMQNLNDHRILRGEIMKGKRFPRFPDDAARFLARTLFHSSDFYLSSEEKKELTADRVNTELCRITEDFVFTHPYEDNETNEYNPALSGDAVALIQKDAAVRAAVGEMKYAFMTQAEALLHGDLHIGSVMANERETYFIDPEFAFVGPMGFDIGALIGNLYLAYFSHDYRQRQMGNDPAPYRRWLLDCVERIWEGFSKEFCTLWRQREQENPPPFIGADLGSGGAEAFRQQFMSRLLADSIGFAACKMMRRIVGLAKVADIAGIEDPQERARAEENALRMGARMVVGRRAFASIRAVNDLAEEISPLQGSGKGGASG